jgi:LPS-assembly lipoprotein
MLNFRRVLILLSLILAASLAGCGFKLRGEASADMPFKTIYLGFGPGSTLGAELSRNIRAYGHTQVVGTKKEAEAILDIIQPEMRGKTVLSMNSQGQVVEYTITYRFVFRVIDSHDKELLPPTTISLKRDLNFNAALALAKAAEEESLYRDMQSDLTQQILRRLSAIKPAEAKDATDSKDSTESK